MRAVVSAPRRVQVDAPAGEQRHHVAVGEEVEAPCGRTLAAIACAAALQRRAQQQLR